MYAGFAFNKNMRVSAHDFLPQVMVKTGHHADDNDQGHHADGYAGDGHKINDRKELVLFGASNTGMSATIRNSYDLFIAPVSTTGIKSRP